MKRNRDEIDPRRRQIDCPRFGFVEMQITCDCSAIRGWVETMCQNSTRTIKWTAVAMIAGHKANDHIGSTREWHFRESQRCHRAPLPKRLLDRAANLRLSQIWREVL